MLCLMYLYSIHKAYIKVREVNWNVCIDNWHCFSEYVFRYLIKSKLQAMPITKRQATLSSGLADLNAMWIKSNVCTSRPVTECSLALPECLESHRKSYCNDASSIRNAYCTVFVNKVQNNFVDYVVEAQISFCSIRALLEVYITVYQHFSLLGWVLTP